MNLCNPAVSSHMAPRRSRRDATPHPLGTDRVRKTATSPITHDLYSIRRKKARGAGRSRLYSVQRTAAMHTMAAQREQAACAVIASAS